MTLNLCLTLWCIVHETARYNGTTIESPTTKQWPRYIRDAWAAPYESESFDMYAFGVTWEELHGTDQDPQLVQALLSKGDYDLKNGPNTFQVIVISYGWPWPMVCYHDGGARGRDTKKNLDLWAQRAGLYAGVPWPNWLPSAPNRLLPLLPVVPVASGLIGNTLLFALPMFGILSVPSLVRRWSRHLRGACPGCGYDRTGLDAAAVCPECGSAAGFIRTRAPIA